MISTRCLVQAFAILAIRCGGAYLELTDTTAPAHGPQNCLSYYPRWTRGVPMISVRSHRDWHDTARAMRLANEKLWDIAGACEVDSRAVCLLFERDDLSRGAISLSKMLAFRKQHCELSAA
jgi:hypothetical protein